ncbi:FKBP-type peptidyl-prolyl cis-trans isomerase [Nocardia inohanensis]|uniref:FKBP-type peptidyl-prolyl cis-trans isomerase n=1 Tax=Nocardia inohanensis TaxID=209246 RepID=UPI00082D6BA5|nr:FKBP-type peptidyl-prolyl cis-trans isomerase [Nocardia inohanensis]
MRLAGTIGVIAAAGLVLAGCGSSSDNDTKTPSTTASSASAAATGTAASKGRECTADDVKVEGGFGEAPKITIPQDCDAPKQLLVKDLVPGKGAGAATGQPLEMNYSLVTWSDGKTLDSSFKRGEPFTLTLGAGKVIKGWDQGLIDVQQGTRRLLIVPPDLGYGSRPPGGMKPNETLVFVTDAVKVG